MGKKKVVKRSKDPGPGAPRTDGREINICVNTDCKLRKKGCKGFEGCPGYKAR